MRMTLQGSVFNGQVKSFGINLLYSLCKSVLCGLIVQGFSETIHLTGLVTTRWQCATGDESWHQIRSHHVYIKACFYRCWSTYRLRKYKGIKYVNMWYWNGPLRLWTLLNLWPSIHQLPDYCKKKRRKQIFNLFSLSRILFCVLFPGSEGTKLKTKITFFTQLFWKTSFRKTSLQYEDVDVVDEVW